MAFSPSSFLLLGSIFFSLAALAFLFALRTTPWTPFHMALASIIVISFFAIWPQLAGDRLGRTQYHPIRIGVAATILAGSFVLLASAPLFRRRRFASLPRPEEYPDGVFG